MDTAIDQGIAERATRVRFELATAADEAEIRRLLRENPIPGRISISLERGPDAHLAHVNAADHQTIVARDRDTRTLVAIGSVRVRDANLNGRVTRVGYLGELRLDQRHRGRAEIIIRGYRKLRDICERLNAETYFTSIAADNVAARRFLEGGVRDMPTYRLVDRFVTILLQPRSQRGFASSIKIEPCTGSGVGAQNDFLARHSRRFQFAPAWRARELASDDLKLSTATRGGSIVGSIGLWDLSKMKQAVVRGYSPWLKRWRPIINGIAHVTGGPHLSPIGTRLKLRYISHLAVQDDDPEVFAALLEHALRICGDASYAVLGLSKRHPLLRAVPAAFRRHAYHTNLYTVSWSDNSAAAFDDIPCQPEVALL